MEQCGPNTLALHPPTCGVVWRCCGGVELLLKMVLRRWCCDSGVMEVVLW